MASKGHISAGHMPADVTISGDSWTGVQGGCAWEDALHTNTQHEASYRVHSVVGSETEMCAHRWGERNNKLEEAIKHTRSNPSQRILPKVYPTLRHFTDPIPWREVRWRDTDQNKWPQYTMKEEALIRPVFN